MFDFWAKLKTMFNLFGKSAPSINVIDKVWLNTDIKWKMISAMAQANPSCVFVAWFEETYSRLEQTLGSQDQILLAEKTESYIIQDKMVVFAEHYPLPKPEEKLFQVLNLQEVPVMSSLDEPLFMLFGGEKTVELLKKLGMKEDEPIGHSMVTKAIRNAQRKLEEKVVSERKAKSAQEWFALNVS